jgi:hypothetical protein
MVAQVGSTIAGAMNDQRGGRLSAPPQPAMRAAASSKPRHQDSRHLIYWHFEVAHHAGGNDPWHSSSKNWEITWLTLRSPGSTSLMPVESRAQGTPFELIACVLWQLRQLGNEPGGWVNDSIAVLDRRSSPARIEYLLSEPSVWMFMSNAAFPMPTLPADGACANGLLSSF